MYTCKFTLTYVRSPLGLRSFNVRLYHCPELNCMYQFGQENGKHFKTMKYLRQHYQKVHLAKDFVCDDCGKAFTLESQLRKHKKDVCGKVFACRECGWPYESLEALLTHGKRKGHNVKEVIMINKLVGKTNSKLKKDVPIQAANNQPQEQQMESNRIMEDGKHSSFMLNEISGKVVFVFYYSVYLSILINLVTYRDQPYVGTKHSLFQPNVCWCSD